MNPVQLRVHVDANDVSKFRELLSWGGALYDALHYTGDGEWYSEIFDLDTIEGKAGYKNLENIVKDDAKGIEYYIACDECELNPVRR